MSRSNTNSKAGLSNKDGKDWMDKRLREESRGSRPRPAFPGKDITLALPTITQIMSTHMGTETDPHHTVW